MLSDGTTYTGRYKSGDELDLTESVADALVEKGQAEYIDAPRPSARERTMDDGEKNTEEEKASPKETNAPLEKDRDKQQTVNVRTTKSPRMDDSNS